MSASIHDQRVCQLGEGPLWHPLRGQLFWFDILESRLLSRSAEGEALSWSFPGMASAAGWVDEDRLLIASETDLSVFDLRDGSRRVLSELEADNPVTRSNDGRADPFGGFWIGTMGKKLEPEVGGLYRWYKGRLECLRDRMSIPNAICFAPDRSVAYYADSREELIYRQPLDGEGWPKGKPEVFMDLGAQGFHPDGAIVDSEGCLWNAQWGAGRVARYAPDGTFLEARTLSASQSTCPALGGPDLRTLYVTSAADGDRGADVGKTWCLGTVDVPGQAEPRVILEEDAG